MRSNEALPADWQQALATAFKQPSMQALQAFLAAETAAGKLILPPAAQRFNALHSTPLARVKVVILGQDPYPTPGHAHGLSFSVQAGVTPLPRSLSNINKELHSDLGIDNSHSGCLQPWAQQGVLLLNTVLSVAAGQAGSHQKRGWEAFTDAVISCINQQAQASVFILWGKQAQQKTALINQEKHAIIASAHPSPLSARRGFFGSQPFSRTNQWLQQQGREPIDWALAKATA